MIATITFSSIAEWVVGSFLAGFIAGVATSIWFVLRKKKK